MSTQTISERRAAPWRWVRPLVARLAARRELESEPRPACFGALRPGDRALLRGAGPAERASESLPDHRA